ncbi:MAG: NAD(+) diphosphatase [Acetobacteraceae bacterium]|nr:NAD(+) diphosphatase [Acetobacteraceae bacterium]
MVCPLRRNPAAGCRDGRRRGTVRRQKFLPELPTVTVILASRPNVYSGSPLNRVAERREDAAWIEQALRDAESLFVPIWRARNLVRAGSSGPAEAVYVTGAVATALHVDGGAWSFLGLLAERAVFAIDVSVVEDPLPLLPGGIGEFVDLRAVGGGRLPAHEASVLAHARGLMHWRVKHRFCGVCGAPCEPRSAGHVMQCSSCDAQHFPRTDPAVIMLVHREDRCLLGHSTRFPRTTMYSTLAGFVEPGESLEEAVRREVHEETGVEIGAVHYHSSQPWPFPANIMLGFYAEGLSEHITIDPGELRDARWFTREQIRHHQAHGFDLPRPDSIARRLIEDWMAVG